MRIDAHQHYWDVDHLSYFWMNETTPSLIRRTWLPADLKSTYEVNRIDGSVVVQAAHRMEETWWLLDLADSDKSILGVVAWVDLTNPKLDATLTELKKRRKFKGVRHLVQDEPDDRWLVRPEVLEGLKTLAARDIPFDLCIHPRHLPLVTEVAEAAPKLRMVVDHLAKPFIAKHEMEPWARDMAKVAAYKQIYCKLSGLVTEAPRDWAVADFVPYVTHCLNLFGPTRCMFGSDWPVCLTAATWKQVLASFTQSVGPREVGYREKLMGLTAIEFYGLN